MPTSVGSRRSSHAIKQLSVTKDDSFEEEEESEEEEVLIYVTYMIYIFFASFNLLLSGRILNS